VVRRRRASFLAGALRGKEGAGRSIGNAGAAMERFLEEDFDLIVTDLDMPGTNGLELIRWIRTRRPFLPVIIVSGNPPGDMDSEAALPTTNFVREPFGVKNLDAALWAILRQFCG